MMEKCLAFVLVGGGARGAMQVGALRALFEAGYKPNLLIETLIVAINAAGSPLQILVVAGFIATLGLSIWLLISILRGTS